MRIFAIVKKETLHIQRDIRTLYFSLIWPVLLLLLFGYTVSFDVKNISVAYFDLDKKQESRELLRTLKATGSFNLLYNEEFSWDKTKELLKKGKVKAVFVVPEGFSKSINRLENVQFQALIDGSDNNTARIFLGYISGASRNFYEKKLKENLNRLGFPVERFKPPIDYRLRFLYNPSLKSEVFIVPGLIAVIMMIIGTLLTALTIAGEWERGTMEQLLYTPIKPFEVIIGKLFPYFFIGIFQITLVLLTGIIVFKVPFRGNLFLFYFASLLFLLGALGLGLFFSLITRNQQLASMITYLSTFLPAFLLSGFIFPIQSMPYLLRMLSYLVPAKYFLNIIRGIFLKGIGFSLLWQDFLAMLLFSLFFIFISIKRFKKRL